MKKSIFLTILVLTTFLMISTSHGMGGWCPSPPRAPDGDGTTVGVPEPTTMILIGLGLVGLYAARKKFKK